MIGHRQRDNGPIGIPALQGKVGTFRAPTRSPVGVDSARSTHALMTTSNASRVRDSPLGVTGPLEHLAAARMAVRRAAAFGSRFLSKRTGPSPLGRRTRSPRPWVHWNRIRGIPQAPARRVSASIQSRGDPVQQSGKLDPKRRPQRRPPGLQEVERLNPFILIADQVAWSIVVHHLKLLLNSGGGTWSSNVTMPIT